MWVVFVDDTKQKGLRREMGQLLSLGGVAFDETQLASYAEAVEDIYHRHLVPANTELKWSCRKDSWFKTDLGSEVLTTVREECLKAATDCSARASVVVFDLGRTSVQGQAAERQVLCYLYERIAMMVPQGAHAVVVCDKPGGSHKTEDEWIARTLDLTRLGTNYVSADNVVLPILTAPSHHHPHLQLADLVAGSVTAAVAGVSYGLDLMPAVKPLLHASPAGGVPGTGLKLFPDDLINLYHWVLDAESYMRRGAGISLPHRLLSYGEDDGMGLLGSLRSRHYSRKLGGSTADE